MAPTTQAKHFLITGAGRGIGRGLSRSLLQKGHRVFLLDNDKDELMHTVQTLGKTYSRGQHFEFDLCNLRLKSNITHAILTARTFFRDRIDCLINNAAYTGGVGGVHLSDLTLEEWNTSIETNITGPMLMSQACLPMLKKTETRESGGCIIHMSSTRAFMSEPDNEPYSATKGALCGLSQAMAVSLAPEGVRSNVILPGWIHVANECKEADERNQPWEEDLTEDDRKWHLTGRVGKVEDILRAVEYLVDSDFVTGAELVVDGGVTRKMVYPE